MPELPDVAVFKKYFDSTSLHQQIKKIIINDEGILKTSKEKFTSTLEGHSFDHTGQVGKYMFAKVKSDGYLVLHFGMTGKLKYFKNEEKEPEYTQLKISFTNDFHLAYISKRKLGKIDITDSIRTFCKNNNIGPHASTLDKKTFRQLFRAKKGKIKSALMDQSFLSGLGNVYVDEILFQSKIHPQSLVSDLNKELIDEIYSSMKDVINEAIKNEADPEKLPDSFLLPHRKEGEKCPDCGGKVKKISVNNRGTYICPECQKK